MENLIAFIHENVEWAPYIIFGALLLAGLNIPVSEDAMLFISAILAARHPDLLYQLFLGVYLGAYFSDLICYWLGRLLGPKIWQMKLFSKFASKDKVDRIHSFYERYGTLTLIFGRFIPFGVRNALFLSAGLGRMRFAKFAFSDLLACTISCSGFFYLYYQFGDAVIAYVKQGNILIFGFAAIFAFVWWRRQKSRRHA